MSDYNCTDEIREAQAIAFTETQQRSAGDCEQGAQNVRPNYPASSAWVIWILFLPIIVAVIVNLLLKGCAD